MKKTILLFIILVSYRMYGADIVYEASDLMNMAKRSGTLQEKYFKDGFLDPDPDRIDYGASIKNVLKHFGQDTIAYFIPGLEIKMKGNNINGFQLMTPGGVYSTSLRQGFASIKLELFPFIRSVEGTDILRFDLNYMGDYSGIWKVFNIYNYEGNTKTASEFVDTEILNNLYGLTAYTPWFTLHGGTIQNVQITNLHLQNVGTQENVRYFAGGDFLNFAYVDFRFFGGNIEYFDLSFNLEQMFQWLDFKPPFFLNFITGLVNYNYFAGILDNIRSLSSGDFRLYFNPQIGLPPYAMLTGFLEWQPDIGNLNISQFRRADIGLKLYLPVYIKGLFNTEITQQYVRITPPIGKDDRPDFIIGIGFSGGLSYYSDSALTYYGSSSTTVPGFFLSPMVKAHWTIIVFTIEYRYNYNFQKTLSQNIGSYNKPVHEMYLRIEL